MIPKIDVLKKIEGQPDALRLWLYGDGSGSIPRLRYTDSTGQTFQPAGPAIDWQGWRSVLFPMNGLREGYWVGHWGGANDGIAHYPLRLDSLLLLDGSKEQPAPSAIYISGPTLMY